jgi:hypothetical protein
MRHASTENLARYAEGDLRPRRRARIAAHLSVCVLCTENSHRLRAVASILAEVSHPSMPEHLSARINIAIASESAARVASEPATEAGRLDLPERKRSARGERRFSRLSSPFGLRLVAAAGAAVVVAAGGYAIATGLGSIGSSSGPSSVSAPSVNSGGASAHLSAGPALHYNVDGRAETFHMVQSATDFKPGTFQAQTLAAVNAERQAHAGQTVLPSMNQTVLPSVSTAAGTSVPAPSNSALKKLSTPLAIPNLGRLQACVGLIAAGHSLLLVESALFEGHPAMIIVVPAGAGALEAYAVGAACSGTDRNVLFSLRLPGP